MFKLQHIGVDLLCEGTESANNPRGQARKWIKTTHALCRLESIPGAFRQAFCSDLIGSLALPGPWRTGPHPPCSWRPRAGGGWACAWGLRLQGSVPSTSRPHVLGALPSSRPCPQPLASALDRPASEEQRVHPQPSEFREVLTVNLPPHAWKCPLPLAPSEQESPPGTQPREEELG